MSPDARALRGAPKRDSHCTGTAMPDYLRVSDLTHAPEEIQARYPPGHPQPAELPAATGVPQGVARQTA